MLRMRTLIPVLLLSLAVPAAASEYSICLTASDSLSCVIEQVEFTRQRNVEINASMALVESVRAIETARNAEINASIAAVNAVRARQFAREQNALINVSIAAVKVERDRQFAADQNALINASMAAVVDARKRDLALSLTHCKTPDSTTPACEAERARDFAAAQNAQASASMARVREAHDQAFAKERNREINASLIAVRRAHDLAMNIEATHCAEGFVTQRCAAEQSRELALSLTHCKSADDASPRCEVERTREFAAARNAEINAAFAAYEGARAQRLADAKKANDLIPVQANGDQSGPLETGALGVPAPSLQPEPERPLNRRISGEPCHAASKPVDALQFSAAGVTIDDSMKPVLDRLASIARACPDVRIELHGHTDAGGSLYVNRMLSQARAQSAADYLIGTGIAADRLEVIGHGALQPLVANTNQANRVRNRRIEFRVVDPVMQAAGARMMWELAELLDPTYVPQLARLSP